MPLAVVTVNNASPALDRKAQEVQVVARALELAAHAIRKAGGATTSGNIIADGGVTVGTWTYTAQASS
jgi:hypothetical protein